MNNIKKKLIILTIIKYIAIEIETNLNNKIFFILIFKSYIFNKIKITNNLINICVILIIIYTTNINDIK